VLDTKRSSADRVPLGDKIEFVREYLALESLRLGKRLQVDWQLDPATLADEIPSLSRRLRWKTPSSTASRRALTAAAWASAARATP
jgi:hypothetical protein